MNPITILLPVIAYILGSVPFGLLISRHQAGIDILQAGSGNIGATNVARVLGIRYGIATLALDCVKGFLPVYLALILFSEDIIIAVLTGISALLGHMFSLFLRLRGGKGIATGLGVFLALSPVNALISMVLFIITVLIWDFISLGSIVASLAMPLILCIFGESPLLIAGSSLMSLLICLKHGGNIKRLLAGKEPTWRKKRDLNRP